MLVNGENPDETSKSTSEKVMDLALPESENPFE